MKRNRKVIAENGQEIEVSLLVDGGVRLSYECLEQDEGEKPLSISINQSGIEIKSGFPASINPTEKAAIIEATADIYEELFDVFAPTPQE